MIPNENYKNLKDSYLFYNISQKVNAFIRQNEGVHIYRMGIGDVSLPLCEEVIKALHKAVNDQSAKETFHGYMPECGADFFRKAVGDYYRSRGILIADDEVFVSSGASDELGDILDLLGRDKTALIMEPAYPAYVDANIIWGNRIVRLDAGMENGFLPMPSDIPDRDNLKPDIIYICSPNNPTGAVYDREKLSEWVGYAIKNDAVILFDAAYEAFIEDEALPHSIFEIEGAEKCAIEICSLSKTAGFTGTRCGYTVIPKTLERAGMNLNSMWVRNRTTKTNGVSYIIQRGAAAVFTEEGQRQIKENIKVYKNNAHCLMKALDRLGIKYTGGKNAPYIWMQCPGNMGSWEFFDYLLSKAQIVGTPGEGFGKCGEGYFRFSTFGSPEDTEESAARLVRLLG